MATREASRAGSWYTDDGELLSRQLDGWLSQVTPTGPNDSLPRPNARAIIAPHAGYSYSGPTAAWAYRSLDLSKAKRVFLLAPSHHFYLPNCALTACSYYETPLGNLKVDEETISELMKTGKFDQMPRRIDEDEHGLEMQLPYIHKVLSNAFRDPATFPKLVPVLVGNTNSEEEREFGAIFAPYLKDETSVFVVSSDFAHWGARFRYTYYLPAGSSYPEDGYELSGRTKVPKEQTIHESIGKVDRLCMACINCGSHAKFLDIVERTGNTICGRHPIGIIMAALEKLDPENSDKFTFVRYERSSDCVKVSDSSVSYASAYARIR